MRIIVEPRAPSGFRRKKSQSVLTGRVTLQGSVWGTGSAAETRLVFTISPHHGSLIANPRVEPAIQDISEKVGYDHQTSEHKNHRLDEQYLRQNWSTCKGYCRFIELLSATTTTPNPQEALDGHFSMFAMPSTHRPEDNAAPMPPHCSGDVGHDGACDDVGPVPVGWPRGQLSDRATLFRDSDPVGHAVLGVLSAPGVSVRGCLPARGRRSRRHQSWQDHPWSGSVLRQPVWQAGARVGLLHPGACECPGTALVSHARRASRAQRRGESRQQGESGSQEGQSAVRSASTWASKGQQEHTQSRRNLHAGIIAYYRLARRLAAPDRRGGLLDLLGAGRALWQPQRLADDAAAQPAPDFQAAVRCGTVLSLHWPLCWAGPPS